MKQGSNSRRSRGRGKGHGQGRPQKIHNFDSNGPEGRVRGNAQQVYEKYLTMARDAMAAGDRIAMENYFQHAEHYLRVIMASDNGNGRLEAIRKRFGADEFGEEEGMEGDEDQPNPGQSQAQPQRPQQGNGEGREARSEGRDGGGNTRKVQIEKSDERQPKHQEGDTDTDDDSDDDEGLRRTLAL
jgi:hypothetical protein